MASYTKEFKKDGIRHKLSLCLLPKEWKKVDKFCKEDPFNVKSKASGCEELIRKGLEVSGYG